ncbi:MAG TPA: phosphoribosylformylglycinamidine synthase subunit PurS [Gemmatimonadota bacterium]|nr:phosphoribosylformylglycinamidine synthase subunit PurS [Gemmatimonadota bacterium]
MDGRTPREATIASYAVEVRVMPREGILDPEGQTIGRALGELGYEEVRGVRAGRLVRLSLDAEDAEAARERAAGMCEELLANPVIEDYEIDVREGDR